MISTRKQNQYIFIYHSTKNREIDFIQKSMFRSSKKCIYIKEVNYLEKKLIESYSNILLHEKDCGHYYLFDTLEKKVFKMLYINNINRKQYLVDLENSSFGNNNFGFRDKPIDNLVTSINKNFPFFYHADYGLVSECIRNVSESTPLISHNIDWNGKIYDAHGRATTLKKSFYLSVLESLERLHGAHSFNKKIICSEKDATFDHIGMENLNKIFDKTYHSKVKIGWSKVYSVKKKRNIYIPTQFLYFGQFEDESRYVESTSNGIAIGTNDMEACISALFELIERDSFFVHWYTQIAPPVITDIEKSENQVIRSLIEFIKFSGYKINIFDITSETEVPTVWVLFQSTVKSPDHIAFYTAASTGIHYEDAITSALIEGMSSIRAFVVYYKNYPYPIPNKEDIRTLDDHILYYAQFQKFRGLDFALKSNKKRVSFTELQESTTLNIENYKNQKEFLGYLIGKILSIKGIDDIYFANMSSDFLIELGLSCIKAVIPDMQDISFGYNNRNINVKRIQYFAEYKKQEVKLNEEPHPFP